VSARRVVVGRGLQWLVVSLMLVLAGGVLVSQASAAGSSIAIISDSPNPQPSGQASTYTINFTCSAVSGNTCGANPTITIPLDLTSSNPATPAMSTGHLARPVRSPA
jgi:hypothetical protein